MKRIYITIFTVILNGMLFSCDPEELVQSEIQVEACCGDGEDVPPPPPPPDK
ncbi:hypothetical protein [Maribacter flavus]|uniref:hypothetical protein n=1 Tax=Maribacter flavus TaxID=1658664 RepID=UPI0014792B81|nr:hypothetical protein [Maribacter flavus]